MEGMPAVQEGRGGKYGAAMIVEGASCWRAVRARE